MAVEDWRRYYVPVFADPRIYGCGTFTYLSREMLIRVCGSLCERYGQSARLVGILAIKGKTASIQRALFAAHYERG